MAPFRFSFFIAISIRDELRDVMPLETTTTTTRLRCYTNVHVVIWNCFHSFKDCFWNMRIFYFTVTWRCIYNDFLFLNLIEYRANKSLIFLAKQKESRISFHLFLIHEWVMLQKMLQKNTNLIDPHLSFMCFLNCSHVSNTRFYQGHHHWNVRKLICFDYHWIVKYMMNERNILSQFVMICDGNKYYEYIAFRRLVEFCFHSALIFLHFLGSSLTNLCLPRKQAENPFSHKSVLWWRQNDPRNSSFMIPLSRI